jgi:exonuclease SbcC
VKVLAIRGKNLASLTGPFEIDFEKEPLAGAGLFAITGPTGAGKSTLLDALCLALFDKTPRLNSRGGPAIGMEADEDRLVAYDVRSLMSRGASEASAEVDFVGRDGARWRATWSVARARGKATGKVQKQNMRLESLDTGRSEGGTKSETLEAIESKVGLSFDQFRKSVLLAQGDFADFLKADASERSLVLQRLTGTEIYEAISKRAYERAKSEQEALQQLKVQRERTVVLDDSARAALEAEIALSEERVRGLEVHEKTLADLVRGAKSVFDGANEAARLTEEASSAEEAAKKAEDERATTEGALEKVAAARDLQKQEDERLNPEVNRARELDTMVEAAEREVLAAIEKADASGRALDEAKEALASRVSEQEEAERTLAAVFSWLAANEESKELANRWTFVRDNLDELTRVTSELAVAEADELAAKNAIDAARETTANETQKLEKVEGDLAAAAGERNSAEEELAGIPMSAMRAELDGLTVLECDLTPLPDLAARAASIDAERRGAEGAATTSRADAEKATADRDEATRSLQTLQAQVVEARKNRERAIEALGLADRRNALVAGTPCPLCGALDHPWAINGAPGESFVDELRQRVQELEEAFDQTSQARVRAATNAEQEEAKAAASDGTATQRRKEGADAAARWNEALTKLGTVATVAGRSLPADPLDPAAGPVSQSLLVQVRDRAACLRDALGQADRVATKAKDAREKQDRLTVARDRVHADREKALEAERKADLRLAGARTEVGNRRSVADTHVGQLRFLNVRRPELRDRVVAAPAQVRSELEAEVATYQKKAEELAAGQTERSDAEKRTVGASAAVAPLERQAAETAQEQDLKQETLSKLQNQRTGLLGGKKVEEVEQSQRQARVAQEEAYEKAGKAATGSVEKASSARATAGSAATRAAQAREALRTAAGAFDARRAAAGVPAGDGMVERAHEEVEAALVKARDEAEGKRTERRVDDGARESMKVLEAQIAERETAGGVWVQLNDLVGSADGKKFRTFVQSLTLEALVLETNHHLRELARRYRLERVPDSDMDLQVIDDLLGEERRAVQSLSGGETFLVSLALALGLSSLATRRTRVETLFVDEGFGTLDADTLDKALTALEALQATGRRVGVISHVADLSDRIGTRVVVIPVGGGRSKVDVVGK